MHWQEKKNKLEGKANIEGESNAEQFERTECKHKQAAE